MFLIRVRFLSGWGWKYIGLYVVWEFVGNFLFENLSFLLLLLSFLNWYREWLLNLFVIKRKLFLRMYKFVVIGIVLKYLILSCFIFLVGFLLLFLIIFSVILKRFLFFVCSKKKKVFVLFLSLCMMFEIMVCFFWGFLVGFCCCGIGMWKVFWFECW